MGSASSREIELSASELAPWPEPTRPLWAAHELLYIYIYNVIVLT